MDKLLLVGALVLLLALAPIGSALDDWEATCIGDVLVRNRTTTVGNEVVPISDNITCSYGCDAGRRQCTDYSGTPGTAIPIILFLAVEAVALILLVWAFAGTETLQKLISGVMATILLFPLGLLSLNVLVEGVAMEFTWLAWLNFALAFVGVAIVIYSMFEHFREELT